jgi:hypothetical protein
MPGVTAYPGAIDDLNTAVKDGDDAVSGTNNGTTTEGFLADLLNNAGAAIEAIETELGINPSGTFATLLARLNAMQTCRKTADQSQSTTTLANVTDMALPVTIGAEHFFEFYIPFSSSAVGTGVGFTVTVPTLNAGGYIAAQTEVGGRVANTAVDTADALTNKPHTSFTTASGNNAASSEGVAVINTVYIARVHGVLSNPSAAGNIQLQWKSSTAAATTVKKGAFGSMYVN